MNLFLLYCEHIWFYLNVRIVTICHSKALHELDFERCCESWSNLNFDWNVKGLKTLVIDQSNVEYFGKGNKFLNRFFFLSSMFFLSIILFLFLFLLLSEVKYNMVLVKYESENVISIEKMNRFSIEMIVISIIFIDLNLVCALTTNFQAL